jgi:hypothetical protein
MNSKQVAFLMHLFIFLYAARYIKNYNTALSDDLIRTKLRMFVRQEEGNVIKLK